MKKRLIIFVIIFSFIVNIKAQKSNGELWKMGYEKLAEGVYYTYRDDGIPALAEGNSLFVINENDVVVFDALGIPEHTRQLIKKIKELTNNPVKYLIISHGHEDHVRGINEFKEAFPGVTVISKDITYKYIDTKVRARSKTLIDAFSDENNKTNLQSVLERLKSSNQDDPEVVNYFKGMYLNRIPVIRENIKDFVLSLPTLTFSGDELTLHCGSRVIKILNFGPGKTPDDILLWLPKEKILATGDIVASPVPLAFSETPYTWADVMRKINWLDYKTLVPGHGMAFQSKEYVEKVIELVDYVNKEGTKLFEQGKTVDEALPLIDLSKYEKYFTKDDPVIKYIFSRWYYKSHLLNLKNYVDGKLDY